MTGAVIGGLSLGLGALSAGASIVGGIQAGKKADTATRAATGYLSDNLAFQQQQFQHFQDIYGPAEQNLSDFFSTLSPETFAASGLKQYDQQFQAVTQNLQRSFAQRGLDSGAQDFLNQNAALTGAEAKASIRQQAPLQVAQAQSQYLSHPFVNPATAGVSNAFGQFSDFYSGQAKQYRGQQAAAFGAAGKAISGGITQAIGAGTGAGPLAAGPGELIV